MMFRVVVALLAVILLGAFWVEHQARVIERQADEIKQLQDVTDTYRMLQDADVSRGNSSDDLDWLCARSKHSAGCAGRAK